MKEFTKLFKALSDSNRVRILKLLQQKSLCVCEITDILDISTSTVSSHLSILREAGFISDSKDGKWVNYSLNKSSNNPVLHQILAMLPAWLNDDEFIIKDNKKSKVINRINVC